MSAGPAIAPGRAAGGEPCVPGISPDIYSVADFERVSRMIHAEAGIVIGDAKRMLVYSRLAPLVRESGLGAFSLFLDSLPQQPQWRARTIAALTTNHTYFNREPHHYEHFGLEVRPGLLKALAAGQRVRLWSAACSSGEEVWTLAMTLLGPEKGPGLKLAGGNLRFLATDLAPHAVARAVAAQYDPAALDPVPADLRKTWVAVRDGVATISDDLRRLVSFRELNLLGDWPMRGVFDAIFCRNVMIYFDVPTKERLIHRLAQQLAPGGYLYIGHSERVSGPGSALLDIAGPTVYRRRAA
ncbi:CheR family methyltransferase [Alteraurantiacibacter buctensis]|uniref:Chemotaxis protein methyltransferase n=1 Tax=Alteraurantiacibacter buctensis TaxID=1503981 RepID=A0A844YVP0_9SPHN|nr:protein-glutamate O-methyltransferase CheR [Alteraurantiacibacter buctensis]MXO71126.1 protein-glutamate O-methyltransferase CheR [Alteraurantiacibacter buctensis]